MFRYGRAWSAGHSWLIKCNAQCRRLSRRPTLNNAHRSNHLALLWSGTFGLAGASLVVYYSIGREYAKAESFCSGVPTVSHARDLISAIGQKHVLCADSVREFPDDARQANDIQNETMFQEARQPEQPTKRKSSSIFPDWQGLGDKITDAVLPEWAKNLPLLIKKLQYELSMEDGTLADDLWKEAHQRENHPEIEWQASVRISEDELCPEEQQYLRKRKVHVRKALARYLDMPEAGIHPEDVPTIGVSCSGGGLRAMLASTSSYLSAQEAGLFDCVTYTAGVSGSCWAQALYHSSLTGQNLGNLIKHLKARIDTHIAFPPPLLKLLTSSPTHKYLLAGGLEKYRGVEDAAFGLVDIYGLLLAARLMVPKGELALDCDDLKLSKQRRFVDDGRHPLPIYTAVRHDIPSSDHDAQPRTHDPIKDKERKREALKNASFQWFEFTPYELFSADLGAGIPIWSIGRNFLAGQSTLPSVSSDSEPDGPSTYLPELRLPLLLGIYGSAMCATMAHYYKEIRPIVKSLTDFSGLDQLLQENNDDMVQVHPVEPAQIPNYMLGLQGRLAKSSPESAATAKHIKLMDAGMSNNLPIYPLLSKQRGVDVLIVFDASADIMKEDWLGVAGKWARDHGILKWPKGAGWRKPGSDGDTQENSSQQERKSKEAEKVNSGGETPYTLGAFTEWTTPEMTLLYLPLLPHPSVPGVDPQSTPFLSTWNFTYTPEQVDQVVALAKANFGEGEDGVKEAVRKAWQAKKRAREEFEAKCRITRSIDWKIADPFG